MHTTTKRLTLLALAGLTVAAACAPNRVHQEPILVNGQIVPAENGDVAAVRTASQEADQRMARDSIAAKALADCSGVVCNALARGEVALGMNETQVLAATRTTYDAWTVRRAGDASVFVPRRLDYAPRDATGELAMVQVADGRVRAYSYRESQGIRVVSTPADATTAGRAAATADMLVREGDEYAARGQLDLALNRYDRASILKAEDPEISYRIAATLDKALRPIEALIQYQLFLHQMELENIEAYGDAYAKMAEAVAYAKERVIVLEHRNP